jgi:anti-sigma-K factor RskA
MVAAGAGTLAAALALVLLARPQPPEPQLALARIEGEAAGPLVRARFDQSSGVITLDIQGFTPGPMVPELWVIPDGGAPVSLGQLVPVGRAQVAPDTALRKLLRDGTTLAITLEPASATRHAAPSSAPVAVGKMTIL